MKKQDEKVNEYMGDKKIVKMFNLVVNRHKNEKLFLIYVLIGISLFLIAFTFFFSFMSASEIVRRGVFSNCNIVFVTLVIISLSFFFFIFAWFYHGKFKKSPFLIRFFVPGWKWYWIFVSYFNKKGILEVKDEELKEVFRNFKKKISFRKKIEVPEYVAIKFNKIFTDGNFKFIVTLKVRLAITFLDHPFPLLIYNWCQGDEEKFTGKLAKEIGKGRFLLQFDNFFREDIEENLNNGSMTLIDIEKAIKRMMANLKERAEKKGIICSFFPEILGKTEEAKVKFKITGLCLMGINFLRHPVGKFI